MTPDPLRLGWRRRAARQLRALAALLDDRRKPPVGDLSRRAAARRHLGAVPGGYAQGRADLQLTHGTDALLAAMYADPAHPLRAAADAARRADRVIPREEWEAEGLEQTIARHAREGEQP